jgi:tartrate-resistant acid phosphatase type 5
MKRSIQIVFVTILIGASQAIAQSATKTPKLQVDPGTLNFIVMGDWGRNGDDHQKEVATQMGKTAKEASVDFIIATGDNFYPDGVASEFDPLWKYSFEDIYTAYSLHWDWYPVLGNHDYGGNPDAQVAYSKISRRWEMPARYYSKTFNLNGDTTQQMLIAFIDTNPLVPYYYSGNGHNVHSQDSTAQKIWLERLLANPSTNIKWKLVVGHHPMYTGGGRTEGRDTRAMRGSLQPLFEKYKVDAYLTGHEHSLQHHVTSFGTHHFTSGSASERTPVRMLPVSKFVASVYGFMLFSAKPSNLMIQVIDWNGKIMYTTSIKK